MFHLPFDLTNKIRRLLPENDMITEPFSFFQKIQENIYTEQVEIFGEKGKFDNVEIIHLTKMRYLRACIKVRNYHYIV